MPRTAHSASPRQANHCVFPRPLSVHLIVAVGDLVASVVHAAGIGGKHFAGRSRRVRLQTCTCSLDYLLISSTRPACQPNRHTQLAIPHLQMTHWSLKSWSSSCRGRV